MRPPSLSLTMTERERPIMDLNLPAIEHADAPAGPDIEMSIGNPQEHLELAQVEHSVATTACEMPSHAAGHSVLTDMTTMDVVKEYRLRTDNAGAAAEFPGEVGKPQDGQVLNCACCNKMELSKRTLICDVCEQSFHLRCLKLKDSQAVAFDEWVCASCATGQQKPNWPLGRIGIYNQGFVRTSGFPGSQQLTPSESGFGFDGSQLGKINQPKQEQDMDQNNSLQDVDQKAIAVTNSELEEPRTRNTRFKSLSHSKEDLQAKGSSDYGQAGPISSHQTSESLLSRDLDDGIEASSKDGDSGGLNQQHLQRLKEFVAQRGGQIEDDWTVSVKKRAHSGKAFDVTFYSPDGVKFRSRLEVARYLGLLEQKKGEAGVRGLSAPAVRTRRKKESSKIQKHEDYSEEVEQSDDELAESAKRRKIEPDGVSALQEPCPDTYDPEPELQVPLQCMELKVESLGTVELRPGYYDENSVWPVGYRCSWHDVVTGSVCISEVLDGGPHTPIFRVTRKLCSDVYDESSVQSKSNGGMPKPDCEKQPLVSTSFTELKSQEIKHDFSEKVKLNGDSRQIYDEDSELETLVGTLESFRSSYESQKENKWGLSTDTEDKFFTSTDPELNLKWIYGDSDARNMNLMYATDGNSLAKTFEQEEEKWCGILEGRVMAIKDDIGEIVVESSSSAAAWRLLGEEFVKRFRQSRRNTHFQFGCKHLESSLSSGFHCPFLFEGTSDNSTQAARDAFETVCSRLMEWMAQDRFGFDIPVVQKYLSSKKSRLQTMRSPPPTGWPIGRKVSAEFVGDLLQIWEFLCRFSEVLGQKEPPSLEELEEGIASISEDDMKRGGCKKDQMGSTRKNGVQLGNVHQGAGPQKQMHGQEFLRGQEVQNGDVGQTLAGNCINKSKRLCENSSFTPSGFCGESLAASNISLLKVALSDLQQKVTAGTPDLTLETKRGKKKDADSGSAPKQQAAAVLPLNELTWPEVARRYIIGLLTFTCGENTEMNVQERRKVLRCIQGDGGVLCGALDGVAAIEADAQLLAEAEKHLLFWLRGTGDQKSGTEPSQKDAASNRVLDELLVGNISRKPAWATVLEPVRKLATNVGARIRNCIRDALELNPPDWAREILEWSISKEVYKGNASGPTKRAVLSVLEQVPDEVVAPAKPEQKIVYVAPTPELVMMRCRIVLRELITTDDVRVFCNSLGGTVLGYYENEDENLPLPLPLVTRPLDFRMIDSRLAAGAYGSSHESFAADMRQLFRNIPLVFNNRQDLVKVGEVMSQHFETMYEEKVLKLANGKEEANEVVDTSVQMSKPEPKGAPSSAGGLDEELKKAPWEEGVCKICGIDKDDDSTLLCDGCDAEYHIYCLEPPLSKIPDGNWYCPSCVALEQRTPSLSSSPAALNKTTLIKFYGSKHSEAGTILPALVASMNGKDYWQMNESERVQLLKFLCDKVLESTLIRDHVDQSVEISFELQQRLRVLILERQNWLEKESHTLDDNAGMDITNESGLAKRRGRKALKATVGGAEDTRMQIEQIRTLEGDDCQDMHNYMKPQIGSGNNRSLFSREESGFTSSSSFLQQKHDVNGQHTLPEVEGGIAKVPQWGSSDLPVKNLAEEFNSTKNHSLFESDVVKNATVISDQSNGLAVRRQETGEQLTANFKEPEGRLSVHQYPLNYADGSTSFNSPDKGQLPRTGLSLQGIGEQWAAPSTANQAATAIQTSFELLETEIEKLEAEIMKTAPRRECLGRDALGRTYWALGWSGKVPWLVVEAASGPPASLYDKNNEFTLPNYFTSSVETRGRCERAVDSTTTDPCASQSNEWIAYDSDDCLEQLLNWLEPTIGTEKSLKSSLTKWCMLWNRKFNWETDIKQISLVKPSSIHSSILTNTKALAILTKMFGPMCWSDGPSDMGPPKRVKMKKNLGEGRLFRCDCLELVWATRSHCPRCHQTYDSASDIQAHNYSGCGYGFTAEEQNNMLLASTKFKKPNLKQQVLSPPDLSVVSKRFSLPSSNRERILQIGWLASKGPEFAPGLCVSPLFDPSLHMENEPVPLVEGGLSDVTNRPSKNELSNSSCAKVAVSTMSGAGLAVGETVRSEIAGSHLDPKLSGLSRASLSSQEHAPDQRKSEAMTAPSDSMTRRDSNRMTSQLASTHPSNIRIILIVKMIKSNLLDIEAALASDSLEPSRGQPYRRRAWRSFVKSADSVLELFQALMLLEQMVKAECLRETWSNWTTLSVGSGINTLAALALRIYAFDAAIKYKRSSLESDTEDSDRPGKVVKKKRKKNTIENVV